MAVFSRSTSPTSSPMRRWRATSISRVITRHQQITEAAPLPVATHLDRVFGLSVIRIRGEARHSKYLIGISFERDQRHFAIIVDLRQPRRELMAKPFHRGKKAKPQILRAHVAGQILQQRLVLGTDRTQSDEGPVAQPFRGFELPWVRRS